MLCADVTSRMITDPDHPVDVYSFWFVYTANTAMPHASAPPQEYGVGMPGSAYPPPRLSPEARYGVTGGPPPMYNDTPPTYSEATGWSFNGVKE